MRQAFAALQKRERERTRAVNPTTPAHLQRSTAARRPERSRPDARRGPIEELGPPALAHRRPASINWRILGEHGSGRVPRRDYASRRFSALTTPRPRTPSRAGIRTTGQVAVRRRRFAGRRYRTYSIRNGGRTTARCGPGCRSASRTCPAGLVISTRPGGDGLTLLALYARVHGQERTRGRQGSPPLRSRTRDRPNTGVR